jgi:hypothetical protein
MGPTPEVRSTTVVPTPDSAEVTAVPGTVSVSHVVSSKTFKVEPARIHLTTRTNRQFWYREGAEVQSVDRLWPLSPTKVKYLRRTMTPMSHASTRFALFEIHGGTPQPPGEYHDGRVV